ncbi:MAG TPA: septum formation initiator family protein [Candidatus Nitrosotenuis sp.]|jgi:cell division protein FtsB|nr:septum formation initiator family protein [Candidatus Nitrosotenuis sp.]
MARKRASSAAPLVGTSLASLLVLVLLGLIGYSLYVVCGLKRAELRAQREEMQAVYSDILTLRSANHKLRQQVAWLRTDQGAEEVARAKLGMVRPGEVAYVVVPGPPPEETGESSEAAPAPPLPCPWWQKLLEGVLF